MSLFDKALAAHLIADWLLQNEWMAKNKTDLRHPAAWVHAGLHVLVMSIALGPAIGVVVGIAHLLIDTRVPLRWWSRLIKQTTDGSIGEIVSIVSDQVLHIVVIAIAVTYLA